MFAIQLSSVLRTVDALAGTPLGDGLKAVARRLTMDRRCGQWRGTQWRGYTVYLLPNGRAVMQSPRGRTVWTKRQTRFEDQDAISLFVLGGARVEVRE